MKHIDLFSGIGGFAIAAEDVWPDIEHVFCEIDPFCVAILKKHWPKATIYGDIRTLTNTRSKKQRRISDLPREKISETRSIDLLTGGFPCQPFSHAGKRKGTSDDRHLWPEMRRVIQEFQPHYVVAENVRGLLSIDGGLVFESVCVDLEAIGYEVQPFLIPACSVDAPHRRDRIWIVAKNTQHEQAGDKKQGGNDEGTPDRTTGSDQNASNPECERYEGKKHQEGQSARYHPRPRYWDQDWPEIATRLCRLDDGLPEGVSRPRGWRNAALKAYGNAIVPQVAAEIFKVIKSL